MKPAMPADGRRDRKGSRMKTSAKAKSENATTVLRPPGDLVAPTMEAFRKEVRSALRRRNPRLLVLDLVHVRMVDSVGLGVLIAAHNALRRKGVKLELINVSGEIRGLLEAMRLDRHFEIRSAS